jgi:hypothetical protein
VRFEGKRGDNLVLGAFNVKRKVVDMLGHAVIDEELAEGYYG